MKKIFAFLLLFACLLQVEAQEKKEGEGIRFFKGSWEEALKLAKKENKFVFLDVYGPWCGGCVNLERRVFPVKKVGDFYNKHFVCVKFNMEDGGEGSKVGKRYDVTAYPTLIFFNPEGYELVRELGYRDVEQLLALGEKVLASTSESMEQRFVHGERGVDFVKEYMQILLKRKQPATVESLLNTLFEEQGIALLQDEDYWKAYVRCAADINAPLSLAFVDNYKKMYKAHGADVVNQKIRNLYAGLSVFSAVYTEDAFRFSKLDEGKLQTHLHVIKERKLPDYKLLQAEVRFTVALREGKQEEALRIGEHALKKADARQLCNFAALGERLGKGKEVRTKMAVWADRAAGLCEAGELKKECLDIAKDLKELESMKYGAKRISLPMRGE